MESNTVKEFKRKNNELLVWCFPDSGPEQSNLSRNIEDNGGETGLYDGCVENNVKTSTEANWRWSSISIEGSKRWATIGDFIVKSDGRFNVYSKEEFENNFEEVESAISSALGE